MKSELIIPGPNRTSAAIEFDRAHSAMRSRRLMEAISRFDLAEKAGFVSDECSAGRWNCWMLLGDFEHAWRESDQIDRQNSGSPNGRLWDGSDYGGKRVLIRCLNGFGDAIQFIRYGQLMRQSAASISVETHPELTQLFSSLPYIDRVVTWADGSSKVFKDWDYQVEVMELPRVFHTTADTVPASIPYIYVNDRVRRVSRKTLKPVIGQCRVGLVWGASGWNPARSIEASQLRPYFRSPNTSFYSFQRGTWYAQLGDLRQWGPIHDTAEHSVDIVNTAADLTHMDVVITVDTMIAHLAGALGVRVWTLLPWEADWRWMVDRDSSPWYPTMTLFRQTSPDCWSDVIERVAQRLCNLAKS